MSPRQPKSGVTKNTGPNEALKILFCNALIFLAPVWGIVLFMILLWITPLGKKDFGSVLLIAVGVLLPFSFLRTLWLAETIPRFAKVVLFIGYYIGSCVVMFAVGWGFAMELSKFR